MALWDDDVEALREAIAAESAAFVGGFPPDTDDPSQPAVERARLRRQAEAPLVLRSEHGVDRTIDGPAGPLRLRQFVPAEVRGAMLHLHGGGWMTGSPELTDLLNEGLALTVGLAVVSVDYRLAPEHPFPAGPDDCEAAALWLLEHAAAEFGTDRLLIGGESAGGHLSALTLLRLRDRHDAARRFCGANLVFGAYDLGGTPSARGVRRSGAGPDILDLDDIEFMVGAFVPGRSREERRRPDLSPLAADLVGMPPAFFTVGTDDHLVDDTLFMADRWQVAGNEAELAVYPGAPHGCMALPTVFGHWWPRLTAFLGGCLER